MQVWGEDVDARPDETRVDVTHNGGATMAMRGWTDGAGSGSDGWRPDRVVEIHTGPRTRESLAQEIAALDCAVAREAGTYDAARIADLRAQIEALDRASQAAREAEWTREKTIARRAAWTDRVRSGEFGRTRVDLAAVLRAEAAQGWGRDDLRAAVERHGL